MFTMFYNMYICIESDTTVCLKQHIIGTMNCTIWKLRCSTATRLNSFKHFNTSSSIIK